jgi:hypothetical protein
VNFGKSKSLAGPPTKKFIVSGSLMSGVILIIWHYVTLIYTKISLERKGELCIMNFACNRYELMLMFKSTVTIIIFEFKIAEFGSWFETKLYE